jgi:hypothetical protein
VFGLLLRTIAANVQLGIIMLSDIELYKIERSTSDGCGVAKDDEVANEEEVVITYCNTARRSVSFVKAKRDVTFANLCEDIAHGERVPQHLLTLSCAGKNLRDINLPHYLATLSQRCSPAAPELHISVSIVLRGDMASRSNKVRLCVLLRQHED